MRIESVEVRNFKVLRHLTLNNIPDLILIAGPNGSGKTALFDALRVFKEAIATYSVRNQGPFNLPTLLQQIGPVITAGETSAEIAASIRISAAEKRAIGLPEEHPGVLGGRVTVTKDPNQREIASLYSVADYDQSPAFIQQLLGGYRSGGELGLIDHIGPDRRFAGADVASISFSVENEEQEMHRLVVNSGDKFANLTQDLVMMRFLDMQEGEAGVEEPHNYIDGIRQIFQHFLPDQEFVDVRIPPNFSGLPEIIVRSSGVEHHINQLSSGQKEILMTYTHLEKLRPTGSIILFDEPELHLHPALQRRVIAHLRRLIDQGNNQFWVITQSEEIVNTTEYQSLFAMTGKGEPAVQLVEERAEQIELLRSLGADVGLQLTSPRILFVEGKSDAELLPRLFGTLPTSISIVDTGGKGTLMRLTPAAMNLLDESIKEGQFYFVRDRDVEDDPTELDELEEKYKGYFFTWDRYHIENYLLDEEAIRSVLADPDLRNCPDPAPEIRKKLRTIADEHKDDVLARHLEAKLNPTLRKRLILNAPEGVRNSLVKAAESRLLRTNELLQSAAIERIYGEVSTDLAKRWDAEWKKMCIGRNLLKEFHRSYVNGLDYDAFSYKVARKIRELDRVPEAIDKVKNTVMADLPTDDGQGYCR